MTPPEFMSTPLLPAFSLVLLGENSREVPESPQGGQLQPGVGVELLDEEEDEELIKKGGDKQEGGTI